MTKGEIDNQLTRYKICITKYALIGYTFYSHTHAYIERMLNMWTFLKMKERDSQGYRLF